MAKKKERKKTYLFKPDAPSEEFLAEQKLKAEKIAAFKKKKRKEKKERKAKHEAELLIKNKPKREAGEKAIEKLKSAREAIKVYKETKSTKIQLLDNSHEASEIQKEIIKIQKEASSLLLKQSLKKKPQKKG